jgi:hypothetical protein
MVELPVSPRFQSAPLPTLVFHRRNLNLFEGRTEASSPGSPMRGSGVACARHTTEVKVGNKIRLDFHGAAVNRIPLGATRAAALIAETADFFPYRCCQRARCL